MKPTITQTLLDLSRQTWTATTPPAGLGATRELRDEASSNSVALVGYREHGNGPAVDVPRAKLLAAAPRLLAALLPVIRHAPNCALEPTRLYALSLSGAELEAVFRAVEFAEAGRERAEA
jgi:hypothetical protein